MLISNLNLKHNLCYAILFAVIIQIVILIFFTFINNPKVQSTTNNTVNDQNQKNANFNIDRLHPDAKSAISRASSEACKKELLEYASKLDEINTTSRSTILINSCDQKSNPSELLVTTKPVTIVFLLSLNGRSVLQIQRLLKFIYSKERHIYYIHVDARQEFLFKKLQPLEREHDNIIVTKTRFNTIWGGTALLQMMLNAFQELSHLKWDFIMNLSESDFPLKTIRELEQYLESNPRSNIYLKTHNLKGDKFVKKQGLDQSFYQCDNRVWRLGPRQLPNSITFSGGSDWFILPKDFCDFILDDQKNADAKTLLQPLLQLFNHTLLPAESFFHTLALNSGFCNRFVDNNLRLTYWNRKLGCKCQHKHIVDWCGCSPLIYRMSDYERLKRTRTQDTKIFFSRKFDPTLSSSVIASIEQQLKPELSTDTRFWLNIADYEVEPKTVDTDSTYKQFGLFALNQSLVEKQVNTSQWSLSSIDAYFKHDKFIGIIFRYCDNEKACAELLVERNISAHLKDHNWNCFQESDNSRHIKVIEVNHGFDTRERVFRNYMPLSSRSDIVVYHEWLVQDNLQTNSVRFEWINPKGEVVLIHQAKLKSSPGPTNLSLVHRLNIKRPLISGLWSLTLHDGTNKCFSYQFLVFDSQTYTRESLKQDTFNEFYQVIHYHCLDNTQSCNQFEWTLRSRDKRWKAYAL